MLDQIRLDNVLFLDIETVPIHADYVSMPEPYQELWDDKSKYFKKEGQTSADVYAKAGIFAEFSKIVCISVGLLVLSGGMRRLRLKSFSGDDEFQLLTDFAEMLNKSFNKQESLLCAHNGKEFDFPFIARRMLVNSMKIPSILDMAGRKPWESRHLDTLEFWKFGDYKHYTSLKLLAYILGISSPKDDIDGSQVADVYWKEKDLPRIVKYCQKDVLTVVQLVLKFKALPLLEDNEVEVV